MVSSRCLSTPSITPESIVYILEDGAAKVLLVESLDRWRKVAAANGRTKSLERIVCVTMQGDADPGDDRVVALDLWLESVAAPVPASARAQLGGTLAGGRQRVAGKASWFPH